MIYYYRYLFVKMKVFNYSELHFAEVTFYKIHTLEKGLQNLDVGSGEENAKKCKIYTT
jgi:hypothetical protein